VTRIPAHVAAGRRAPFPAGVFLGELAKVQDSWSDDKTGLALLLTFTNVTPFDAESPQVGARPKTQRIQVIFDNQSLVDVTDFNDDVPLALQNAATLVTQMAEALGLVKPNADGSVDFELEPFLNDLMAGAFNGSALVFEVRHRQWKSKKTGNSGTDDSICAFKAAGEATNPGTAEAAAAPVPPTTPTAALRGRK
jgi:hypothetical protein